MVSKPEAIEQKLQELNDAYYGKGESLVSDEAFDELKRDLKALNPNSSLLQKVNHPKTSEKTYPHGVSMLSLHTEVDYTSEGYQRFYKKVLEQLTEQGHKRLKIEAQCKMDGLALNLQYQNSRLQRILTRGDGVLGEDVTVCKAFFHKDIPERLPVEHAGLLEIRGEAMLSHTEFQKLNEYLEENNQETRSNPRNAVAGLVRTQDPTRYPDVRLDFFPYGLGQNFLDIKSESELMQALPNWGFTIRPWFRRLFENEDSVKAYDFFQMVEKQRLLKTIDYLVDGVVYKLNDFQQQQELGFRTQEPRWAMAQKFIPSSRMSKLVSVAYSMGRTGKVTPVAYIQPVSIDGVVVSKATLHNIFDIRRRNVRVGDEVTVYRTGDVIPEIGFRSKDAKRAYYRPNIRIPKRCLSCQGLLTRPKGEVHYYCANTRCKAKNKAFLRYFVSKQGMDIKGLGDEMINKLIDEGIVTSYPDIFLIEDYHLEKVGVSSALIPKILKQITEALQQPDWRFICSIGIRHVGVSTAQNLCRHYGWKDIPSLTTQQLQQVPDISVSTFEAIADYFKSESNLSAYKSMDWLIGAAFESSLINKKGKLYNKVVVFSGRFEDHNRIHLETVVGLEGGRVAKEVSSKTDYFVAGKEPTLRKLEKAVSLKVRILDPEAFLKETI